MLVTVELIGILVVKNNLPGQFSIFHFVNLVPLNISPAISIKVSDEKKILRQYYTLYNHIKLIENNQYTIIKEFEIL